MQPKTTLLANALLLTLGCLATACDKEDNGPTAADYARCAHVPERADSLYREFLYQVCLNNPWPTELPPATQEGLSTFGGILNDTLLFVAGSPRAFPDETATCRTITDIDGRQESYRWIRATFGTYQAIDSSLISLKLIVYPDGSLFQPGETNINSLRISHHDPKIDGYYQIDSTRVTIEFTSWNDSVVAGMMDVWFEDSSNRQRAVHLSDVRFDLAVRPQ